MNRRRLDPATPTLPQIGGLTVTGVKKKGREIRVVALRATANNGIGPFHLLRTGYDPMGHGEGLMA